LLSSGLNDDVPLALHPSQTPVKTGVILHLDTVILFVLGNEPIDLAASQVDEPVAALAVKPVAVQSSGALSAPKSSVVAFGSVFLAVEDERICKPVFLEVMEGSVYGY
jgi:hypothetical protein